MIDTHVLSALIKKRSELPGLIDYHRKEIKQINENLKHIDSSIKIFNPDYDLRDIKAKRHIQPCKYFRRGERNRLVLEILRDLDKPLTTEEITDKIKTIKKIEDDIYKTVCSSLKAQYNNGVIDKVKINIGVYGWEVKKLEKVVNFE